MITDRCDREREGKKHGVYDAMWKLALRSLCCDREKLEMEVGKLKQRTLTRSRQVIDRESTMLRPRNIII